MEGEMRIVLSEDEQELFTNTCEAVELDPEAALRTWTSFVRWRWFEGPVSTPSGNEVKRIENWIYEVGME